MKKYTHLFIFLSTALILFLAACIRDIDDTITKLEKIKSVKWNPEFAAPLVSSRLTLNDLIQQAPGSFIEVDDEDLIHIVYRSELLSLKAKDFASIPDEKFDGTITLHPLQILQFQNTGVLNIQFPTVLEFGGEDMEIDSVLMRVSAFTSKIGSDFQHDVKVNIKVEGITKNGAFLDVTYDLPYNGSVSEIKKNVDLSGYQFDLTKSGDKEFSQAVATFDITITEKPGNPITTTDELRFNLDFLYNEYEWLFGYLGEVNISPNEPDTMVLDIFASSNTNGGSSGTFYLENPKIKVIIGNSYGLPIKAHVDEFSTYSDRFGTTSLNGLPDPIKVPNVTKADMGKILRDSFYLDKNNSNIQALLSNVPESFIYGAGFIINPPGSKVRNFILYNSQIRFTVDIDIPLFGSADGFVLEKKQPFSLDFDDDVADLESATLRLYLENEFPVDVGVQIYFLDTLGKVLDSLIQPSQLLLTSPVVGPNGKIISPTSKTMDFVLDQKRINSIKNATDIKIRGTLNTYKPGSGLQPPVRFLSEYGFYVKLGVQAKALISTSLEKSK